MSVKTYRQNPETGKFELVGERVGGLRKSADIAPMFEPYVSPIDGSKIRTRKQEADHNRAHGVTNDLDSLKEQTARHQKRQEKPYVGSKEERKKDIIEAVKFMEHNPHLAGKISQQETPL